MKKKKNSLFVSIHSGSQGRQRRKKEDYLETYFSSSGKE